MARTTSARTGVIGLLVSDLAMYLLMTRPLVGTTHDVVFWGGLTGSVIGYAGWLVWVRLALGRIAGVSLDGAIIGSAAAGAFAILVVIPQFDVTGSDPGMLWMLGCLIADVALVWAAMVLVSRGGIDRRRSVLVAGLVVHIGVDLLHSAATQGLGPGRMRLAEWLVVAVHLAWIGVLVRIRGDAERTDVRSGTTTRRTVQVRAVWPSPPPSRGSSAPCRGWGRRASGPPCSSSPGSSPAP